MTDGSEPEAVTGPATTSTGVAEALPPLWVSMALAMWGRALLALSVVLLAVVAAILGGVLVVLSPAAWTIDLMIALTGLPVAVAIPWVVGRSLGAVSDGFVRGVTSTALVAISPPPRPPALATPISTLRLSGLGPAVVGLGALACLVALGDVWAARMPLSGVRVGALAVTCDGLAALAALLLALGLAIGRIGRAVAAYERTVGARFYALAVPSAPENSSGPGEIAVCAVPGLERA